jgi:hypothetical protein
MLWPKSYAPLTQLSSQAPLLAAATPEPLPSRAPAAVALETKQPAAATGAKTRKSQVSLPLLCHHLSARPKPRN